MALEHVQRLAAADLADDDAVRTHAQRVAHEAPDRHLAAALDAGRTRLEPDDVGLDEPQLGGVLDRHEALVRRDERRQDVQRRGLARPGPARHEDRADGRGRRARSTSAQRRPARCRFATRSAEVRARRRKRRIVSTGPSTRQRRQHDVHARPVGQAGVAERLGLVDAAPERREDPLDGVAELRLAREPGPAAAPAARARSTHTGPTPLTMHLVDLRVAQQRLERPEAERALGDPVGQRGPRALVEHRGLACRRAPGRRPRPRPPPPPRRPGARAGRPRARRGRDRGPCGH